MIIIILEVNKHLFKYCIILGIDFQTHVFGYPNTCVLISNQGHPCDPNEASQLVNYLMQY